MTTNRSVWMDRTIPGLYRQINQTNDYLKKGPVRKRFGLGTGTLPLGQGEEIITPQGEWFDGEFAPVLLTFNGAYLAWVNPDHRTHVIVVALHEAMKPVIEVFVKLYNGVIKSNPLCTDEDLAEMGLPVYEDKNRTPSPIPESIPEVKAESTSPAVVKISFRYSNGNKPRSIHGVEILYSVLENMPTDWNELLHSDFATASPHHLTFSGNERGKKLYFSLRWENNRGEKGPWGEIEGILIH